MHQERSSSMVSSFNLKKAAANWSALEVSFFCRAHEHALNTTRGQFRPSCHQWHPICRHSYTAIHPIRGPEVSSHIKGEPRCRFTQVSPSPSAPLMLGSASLNFQGRIGEKALQILHQDRCVDMLARVKTDTALFLSVCPFLTFVLLTFLLPLIRPLQPSSDLPIRPYSWSVGDLPQIPTLHLSPHSHVMSSIPRAIRPQHSLLHSLPNFVFLQEWPELSLPACSRIRGSPGLRSVLARGLV